MLVAVALIFVTGESSASEAERGCEAVVATAARRILTYVLVARFNSDELLTRAHGRKRPRSPVMASNASSSSSRHLFSLVLCEGDSRGRERVARLFRGPSGDALELHQ